MKDKDAEVTVFLILGFSLVAAGFVGGLIFKDLLL